MIESTFGSRKPIIAMIHLAPLPGSPLYDRAGGMQKIVEDSARDIEALQEGGVDAVMFGNEGDRGEVGGRVIQRPLVKRLPLGVGSDRAEHEGMDADFDKAALPVERDRARISLPHTEPQRARTRREATSLDAR